MSHVDKAIELFDDDLFIVRIVSRYVTNFMITTPNCGNIILFFKTVWTIYNNNVPESHETEFKKKTYIKKSCQ